MSFDLQVKTPAGQRTVRLERIKVGATPDNLLLRFGDEQGAEVVVEVVIPAETAARFASSIAQAVGAHAAARIGGPAS